MTTADKVPRGQQRLAAARAELARLASAGGAAPTPTARRLPTPGETLHCLVSGTTIPVGEGVLSTGVVLRRGQAFTVTANMLEASKNRLGQYGGVALAYDEDEQMRRWGQVRFRPGPAPSDLESWIPGDPDWARAREDARRAAHAEPSPERRAEALAEVHRRFGPAAVTSATLNAAPHPSIREAELQRDRIAASGGRHMSHHAAREVGGEG